MKTTRLSLLAVLAVSLFLGGCGTQMTSAIGGGSHTIYAATEHTDDRSPHATLDWNAALNPLKQPSRTQK